MSTDNVSETRAQPLTLEKARAPHRPGGARGKRRVVIVVENLPVPFDRRVWSEATALSENGYEVSVICPKGAGATKSFELIDGVSVYRHWMPREARGKLGYVWEYGVALVSEFVLSLKIFATRGFDVLHACNPPDLIFLVGGFFKYLFGTSFVFDHHDIVPELFEAKFGSRGFLLRLMLGLERWTFAAADVSLATNESYRQIAIERGRMAPEHVHVVRSGPNLKRVRLVPPDPHWRNRRSFLVAYVGVIGRQEGLDLLLDAVEHIRCDKGRDDIQYVIVGGGPDLDFIKALCARKGLDDCVAFTGRVDDETLLSVLSSADVCVNPDTPNVMNDKSTMNKIMEYMALGKPIVQFDLTEGRVSAQEASVYAATTSTDDFGDKICELLDDPERRTRMSRIGQERIRDVLSWDHEIPKLLAAYDDVFQLRLTEKSEARA